MAKIVDIGFRIKKINDLLCKKADETMQKMGVTFSQHHALVYLHQKENQTTTLKIMPPWITQKYVTAASCVSAADPAKRMTSLAKMSESVVKITQRIKDIAKAVTSTSFAFL